MKRRAFFGVVGGAAAAWAWPLAAHGQSAPLLGLLNSASTDQESERLNAFRAGLREAGFTEGQNLEVEYRSANGRYEELPSLAADLVRRKVRLIVAGFNLAAARAAKSATATLPVVFMTGVDPVKAGLVTSLHRPGGNVTGVVNLSNEVVPKYFEILRELQPSAKVVALLVNPANPAEQTISRDATKAAGAVGLELRMLRASTGQELENAFLKLRELRVDALAISPDSLFTVRRQDIVAMALRAGLPTIGPFRRYVEFGALMSYGGNLADQGRQAGIYTGRILNGEKASDLPVVQATKVELVVNLKTAKALGVVVPPTLLARADEVIE